jgi:hypothetical protein
MRRATRTILALAMLPLLPMACGETTDSTESEASEAVASAPPPMAPYVSPATLMTVGADDEDALGFVGDAAIGRDGSIFVADFQARSIHRFDPTGKHVATIGRQGRGPGEFDAISAMAVSGDTVFAWDEIIFRISAFDPDGTLLMAGRVEPRRQSGWPTSVTRLADGTWFYLDQEIVGLSDAGVEIDDDMIRAEARLVRWSPHTDQWTPVATFPGMQASISRSESGEPSLATAPFPRRPLWAPDRTGGYWYADNGAYIVTRFGAAGDTLGRIVVGMQGPPVTDADRNAFITADGRREPSSPEARRRAQLPIPERKPVLRELLTSQQGDLWVGVDAGLADSVEWHAFGADHRMRFRLRLPATSAIRWISGDTALIVTRDAVDVEGVSVVVAR